MISIRSFSKSYEDHTAVDNLNLEIPEHKITGIVGPNGAGKSTTLKSIVGLIKPTQGDILINNISIQKQPLRVKRIIGYMPEESAVYENMKVDDYLLFFASLYNVPKETAQKKITRLKSQLDLKDQLIAHLSKGMKRKLLIIRSLINDPDVLVYDEPISGIDPITTNFLLQFIKKLGKTVIISAHDLNRIEEICDYIVILHKGKVLSNDTVQKTMEKFGHTEYIVKYAKGTKTFTDKQKFFEFIQSHKILDIIENKPSLQQVFLERFKNEHN
ncbi:ABC transporter ATP-binding protein [Candidatus Woesearchaeota archaeon]|nr:ABC transporter ATP-binding protein [Candidatus Woesearchaeota archaeon]